MSTYLERYRAGEYEQVWAELVALGSTIREEPLYAEAQAIAGAMMERIAYNLSVLIQRLTMINYLFKETIWEKPTHQTLSTLTTFEARFGSLPIVLRMWYEKIGDVRFIGSHPHLSYHALWHSYPTAPLSDPLDLGNDMHAWLRLSQDEVHNDMGLPPYPLIVARDICMKAGTSGSGPTTVVGS